MKLGDALGIAVFSAIAGACAAYYLAARSPGLHVDSPFQEGGRAASHSSEGVADSAPISHSSRSVRQDTPSEVSSGPEGTPLQGVPEEDRDVSSVQDSMSPLVFSSEAVQAFVTKHPNSPLRFVPKDATTLQLAYLEGQAEVILSDWQQVRDELWSAHRENLLAFSVDPSVIENDKTRQQRMKSLIQSLWPNAMP